MVGIRENLNYASKKVDKPALTVLFTTLLNKVYLVLFLI